MLEDHGITSFPDVPKDQQHHVYSSRFCRCPDPTVQIQLVMMLRVPHPRWLMQEATQSRTGLSWFRPGGYVQQRGVREHCTVLHRGCL